MGTNAEKMKRIYPLRLELRPDWEERLFVLRVPEFLNQYIQEHFFKDNKKYLKTNNLLEAFYTLDKGVVYGGNPLSFKTDILLLSTKEIATELICFTMQMWLDEESERIDAESEERGEILDDIKGLKQLLDEKSSEFNFTEENFCLTDSKGNITDKKVKSIMYELIPNLIKKYIADRPLNFGRQALSLCFCGRNKELMSMPQYFKEAEHEKRKEKSSIKLSLALHTTPVNNTPKVLVSFSVARWCNKPVTSYFNYYKNKSALVYAELENDWYYPLKLVNSDKKPEWDRSRLEIIKRIVPKMLNIPRAGELCDEPAEYNNFHVVYNLNMSGYRTKVEAGFSMQQKKLLFEQISVFTEEIAIPSSPFTEVKKPKTGNKNKMTPSFIEKAIKSFIPDTDDTELTEKIYHRLQMATNKKPIRFELHYAADTDEKMVEMVAAQLYRLTGKPAEKYSYQEEKHILSIFPNDGKYKNNRQKRINEIKSRLSEVKDCVTACIIFLPYSNYDEKHPVPTRLDPKESIRTGFALTGRLSQFFDSKSNSPIEHRAKSAVLDLLRQLGLYFVPPVTDEGHIGFNAPVSAIEFLNLSYGKKEKRVMVAVNFRPEIGKITVNCPQLWGGEKPYYEAALTIRQAVSDKKQRSSLKVDKKHLAGALRQKLREIHDICRDEDYIVFAESRVARQIWKYIQDQNLIKNYLDKKYDLEELWIDDPKQPVFNFQNNKIRLIRIRTGNEIPEYYGDEKDNGEVMGNTGLYRDGDVYYIVPNRLKDRAYYPNPKDINRNENYKTRGLVEVYPVRLLATDNADEWGYIVQGYTKMSMEYQTSLNLPLPLHMSNQLKEYLKVESLIESQEDENETD